MYSLHLRLQRGLADDERLVVQLPPTRTGLLAVLAGTVGAIQSRAWVVANGGRDGDCATWANANAPIPVSPPVADHAARELPGAAAQPVLEQTAMRLSNLPALFLLLAVAFSSACTQQPTRVPSEMTGPIIGTWVSGDGHVGARMNFGKDGAFAFNRWVEASSPPGVAGRYVLLEAGKKIKLESEQPIAGLLPNRARSFDLSISDGTLTLMDSGETFVWRRENPLVVRFHLEMGGAFRLPEL